MLNRGSRLAPTAPNEQGRGSEGGAIARGVVKELRGFGQEHAIGRDGERPVGFNRLGARSP
jgi:hypothetical protein